MKLGIFLPIGGSLGDLEKNGKLSRFLDYYVPAYLKKFDRIYIFSYANEQRSDLPKNCFLIPNKFRFHRYFYTLLLPILNFQKIREVNLIRVMQLDGLVPAILAKFIYGKRVVVTFGYDYKKVTFVQKKYLQHLGYTLFEKLILPLADSVIFSSQTIQTGVSLPSTKSAFIPNGIDLSEFKPQKRPHHDYFEILTQSRLAPEKNLDLLIKAVSTVEASKPIKVVVIGRGALKKNLMELAANQHVNLEIIDEVPNNKMAEYYHRCDLFVLCSNTEGSPKALIEAAACGCNCLATDLLQNREILGESGRYSSLDQTELAGKILAQLASPVKPDFDREKFDLARNLEKETLLLSQRKILVVSEKRLSTKFLSGIELRTKQMIDYFNSLGWEVSVFSPETLFFPHSLQFEVNRYDLIYVAQASSTKSVAFLLSKIKKKPPVVVDVYTPLILEKKAYTNLANIDEMTKRIKQIVLMGDHFVCATPRQKKYYQKLLTDWGITGLDKKLSVIPFIPHEPKSKNICEKPADGTFRLVWLGAFYPWFSGKKLIEAMNILSGQKIELLIIGGKNPKTDTFNQGFEKVVAKARDLGLLGTKVKIVPWMPYSEMFSLLQTCDAGICLSNNSSEDKLAIRSRMLTMLQANLPLIYNGNDEISEVLTKLSIGLKSSSDSPAELAKQIKKVSNLKNPEGVWQKVKKEIEKWQESKLS